MVMDASTDLNQATQRAFCIRCPGIEEHAIAHTWYGVDAFAQRTRRISTLQRHRRNEQMRKRVQHDVGQSGKLPMSAQVLLLPALESSGKLTPTGRHVCPCQPRLDGSAADIQKDPLTFVLNSRQPGGLTRQGRSQCPFANARAKNTPSGVSSPMVSRL